MAPKRTRGQRDEIFQVDPTEEDEEEPLADEDEDEEGEEAPEESGLGRRPQIVC